eukprot:116920-Rhodomonas_salina.1
MTDIHDIEPSTIQGLTGSLVLNQAGTLCVCVPDSYGNAHVLNIPDCLFDQLACVNLISVKQLNSVGYAVLFLPDEHASGVVTPESEWINCEPTCLPVVQQNN